ncbi:adhesin transport system outer membrane protein [Novosphingobium kunmingense]|uniref:Adhesin transport system outer membrane protein n=2 Tax=Novosphingobium kunmingense TaxID=1211806 RepID=A0A2N0I3F6_9SPHN|nr:adhesin transport system outer membrane protein [Novosphingobium kunmingense]
MTLNEAAATALARSPDLGQADARVKQGEAAEDQAQRDWLPKFTAEANVGFRRLENSARNSLGLSALNEKPRYVGISVDQPIWDMGRRSATISAQKARVSSLKEEREQAAEQATFQAARAYVVALLYGGLLETARANMTFHDRLAADMREGVAQGAMSVSERQQADERRQQARVRLADAERDVGTARNLFISLVGREPVGLQVPPDASPALATTLEEAIQNAARQDPAVIAAQHDVKATQAMVRRAEADGLPTIDAQGSARTGNDFDGFRGKTNDYSALVSMRWRFFDGGVNAARVREAMGRSYEAAEALIKAQRESERGVRDDWEQLSAWRTKLTEQSLRAQVASDLVFSYRSQFGIGRRSLLDVLDAQSASFSAAGERESARASTILAAYSLLARENRLREFLGITERKSYGPE